MTPTIALILNGILAAGIVTALALIVRVPFRLGRGRIATIHRAEEQSDLSRAA